MADTEGGDADDKGDSSSFNKRQQSPVMVETALPTGLYLRFGGGFDRSTTT